MPLVSMKPVLAAAKRAGFGVGAFNPVDYNSMKAIVRAAEAADAPVIAQTSVKTIRYWGFATLSAWMRDLAQDSPVPVSLHVDHCKDLDIIRQCIEHGWTDVMFDGSSFPYEENLDKTRQVVAMATGARGTADVGVEAELGQIGGVEEDIQVSERDAHLADPGKAIAFCTDLDLAVFAPAIGTAHGMYKGAPRIAFDNLEVISTRTGLPIALHGGTGLSDEVFERCIKLGCAKVNISTQLKHAFIDGFCDYHARQPDDYEPLKVIDAQYQRMEAEIGDKIRQFGGAGTGAALLAELAVSHTEHDKGAAAS